MRLFITALIALFSSLVMAAQSAPAVRAEIDQLLTKLQASGCEFNRNGSWYSGAEAKDHLLRKLEYIENKGTLQSTEQFIELAASKSSFSGKAYQVRCGNEPAQESQAWLTKQLGAIRASANKGKP